MFPPRCSQLPCMNIDVKMVTGQSSPVTWQDRSSSHGW